MQSDSELVRLARAGRSQAYGELVRRWAGRITALCHARIGCVHAADDLAQEVLLRGYRALDRLSDPDKFGAWLCAIARRSCLNWLRARERSLVPFSALGPDHKPHDLQDPASLADPAGLDRADELRRLRTEVAGLPPEYREVLTLYYHEKLTYRDLAQMLGVSTATINARLTRARVLLREALSDCRS
jgi:RNA polymerase sigma-70 factor (ECF subfamily)